MTLSEEISTLREAVMEHTPLSRYEDSFLYSIWLRARGEVLKRETSFSRWMYHRFCIEFENAPAHDCGCVAVGCDIKRSKVTIPKAIAKAYGDAIELYSLNGKQIGITTLQALSSDKLDSVKKGKMRAVIYNQKIEVYNAPVNLEYLTINGIWEDLLNWADKQACLEDNPCQDIFELEMGLPAHMSSKVLQQSLKLLGISLNRLQNEELSANTHRP